MKSSPESALPKALSSAQRYCALQERSPKQVETYLKKFELSKDDLEQIIAALMAEEYLNPNRFAAAFARDKSRFQGWGKQKIAFLLRGEGIEEADIREAMASVDEEEYKEGIKEALRNKSESLAHELPAVRMAKLLRFGASRGYETSIVYDALRQLGMESDEE